MNLNLNVLARLMVLNNLPEQGSIEKIMNKRNVRNKISFSSEELDKLNLTTTDVGITWNPIDDITVDFTDTEIKFLNDVIMDIDSKGLISEGFIDFVIDVRSHITTEND
jgi:hypothetical protein